jgi:AbrB family looped-hinge helix DNA binding protein
MTSYKTLVLLTTFLNILLDDFTLHLGHRMRPPVSTLTVTAKGQVTLRKDLLKHLGVQPGDKIAVDKLPDRRIEIKAVRPTGKISDAFGFLKRKDRPSLSIGEMNQIASRGWAGKR